MLSRAYRYEWMSLGLGLSPIWRVAYVDTCVVGPASFLRCHRVRIGSHSRGVVMLEVSDCKCATVTV